MALLDLSIELAHIRAATGGSGNVPRRHTVAHVPLRPGRSHGPSGGPSYLNPSHLLTPRGLDDRRSEPEILGNPPDGPGSSAASSGDLVPRTGCRDLERLSLGISQRFRVAGSSSTLSVSRLFGLSVL